ncbi:MAG: MFS transporter [Paracoccaceae bacterium]
MKLANFLRDNSRWLSAGVLLTMMSSFGQTFFISIFAGEIRGEFGLSHGEWGLIYTIGTSVSALVMIWSGVASDFFRVRVLGVVVLGGLGLSCLFMAINPWVNALVLSVFLLRFFGQGMLSHLATVAMARWFVATRGRALAIAGLGYAICEALLPILVVAFLAWGVGWRSLWIMSACVLLIALPILVRLLSEEREPKQLAKSDESLGMRGRHWTRGEALRQPLFWFVVPAILGPSAFITAFFFHQVHLAEIKGWTHLQLVSLFPVYTSTTILAMFASGWALDRIGTKRLFPLVQIPMALGFAVLAFAPNPAVAAGAFALLGFASGAHGTLTPAFWAEIYGTAHIGAIKALAAAVMVLGSAIGPGMTGAMIDAGIGLEAQLVAIAGWFLCITAVLTFGILRFAR